MSSDQENSGHGLLFGIVAMQMRYITSDTLIAITQEWVQDKSQSLPEFLLRSEAISEKERSFIQSLTDGILDKHNDQVDASIASISTIDSSIVRKLEEIGDGQVAVTLSLSGSKASQEVSTTSSGPQVTKVGERFRIIRPHAQGGLGIVSLAKDQELNREVALKEIQERFCDDTGSRERFLLEAEITGGLQHPGIVPVYGLGHYQDGRPFYAMRFVKGDSLKAAIERFHRNDDPGKWSIDLHKLLRRFVDVCNAIEYAHNRGVLHRDLKPGNVMLGNYGETLVVDWGLAKPVDRHEIDATIDEPALRPSSGSGSSPTQLGTAVGTPAYMSPEQAAGDLEKLGPESDVYSLGATLFSLLTGEAPYTNSDVVKILLEVQEGALRRPRVVNDAVPPALDAICMKSMAHAQAERYPSPRALAEDIERWLADEPVDAYREPFSKRMARWSRRHRTVVGSMAAATCVALVSLALGIVFLSAANQRERAARSLAVDNEQEAKRQQAQAEQNFQLAKKAVDDYLTQISEDRRLRTQSLETLRRDLLEKASGFYEEFVKIKADNIELEAERGYAYVRLASITDSIGSKQDAIDLLANAAVILERVVAQEPDNVVYLWELALLYRERGLLVQATEGDDAGEAELKKAVSLAEQAAKHVDTKDHPKYRDQLAWTYHTLGHFYSLALRLEDSESNFQRAIELREDLLRRYPEEKLYLADMARTHISMGAMYYRGSDIEGQEDSYRNAMDILDELGIPEDPLERESYQNDLGIIYYNLGYLYQSQGQFEAAAEIIIEANEIWDSLSGAHPDVLEYRQRVAMVNQMLGQIYMASGKYSEAKPHLESSMQAWQQLALLNSEIPDLHVTVAQACNTLGSLHNQLAESDEAVDTFSEALKTLERLEPEFRSRDVMAQVHQYDALFGRATAFDQLHEFAQAANDWKAVIDSQFASHMGGADSEFDLQMRYLRSLAMSGDYPAAAKSVDTLTLDAELSDTDKFKAACIYGVIYTIAKDSAELPADEREKTLEDFALSAIRLLESLNEAGFFENPQAKSSLELQPELADLRELEVWRDVFGDGS